MISILSSIGLQELSNCYYPQNMIKRPTSFKGEASCTDLVLTNHKDFFKHSIHFATWVSGVLKLNASATKTNFVKSKPKTKDH